MPETLTMSTGVSLGLLAGIVSGVCYIIANGLAWPRSYNHKTQQRCLPGAGRVCRRCGGDCDGGGVPCICDKESCVKFESGLWFLKQARKTLSLMPWSVTSEKLEQIDEESDGAENSDREATREELRNVREFLETLSARLAGGTLEGTRVAPLYHHPAYLPSRTAPDHPAATSSGASGAHAQLKRLVARVVEEAAALPALARYAAEPSTPTDATTYEDLLATAILNKVIERYQTENESGGRSSGIHSASASPTPSERSSPRSLRGRINRDITPPLREEEEEEISDWEEGEATASDDALEMPRRIPFPEFGGDIVHHTDNEEREFDEVSGSDIQAVDGSWEENWLFQKKKIKTLQSVPVPMLVPNSNTEYRAMIGDRDVDDTTDLSDNASDAEEELEFKSDVKRILDCKHVIGGKLNVEDDYEPDSLTIVDEIVNNSDDEDHQVIDAVNKEVNNNSNNVTKADENGSKLVYPIDSGPIPKAEFNLKEEIHRSLMNGHAQDYSELNGQMNGEVSRDFVDGFGSGKASTTTTLSRHEREGEYEETVTLPVQRYADSLRRKHFDDEHTLIPTRDTDNDELIPGTIAYRERQKWLNAVEMPNNPYSPEAIQKRLTAKSTSSLFDMITSKNSSVDDDLTSVKSEVITRKISKESPVRQHLEKNHNNKHQLSLSVDNVMNGSRSNSPSPRILKDVLAEEVPQYKRYGRDYYIREAKKSAGSRKKSNSDTSSQSSMNHSMSLDNMDREFTSPGLLIKQFNTIASNQQYTKFATKDEKPEPISIVTNNNKTDILIEYEDINEQTLFSAKPVYVDDETDKKFEEILEAAYSNRTSENNNKGNTTETEEPKSPNNLCTDSMLDTSYISSSSMDDSIKIYNVPTGEIVKSKPDSLSERYAVPDKNDNIDMPDKNTSLERLSQNGDASEESLVIIENLDSLNSHKLDNISEIEEILPQLPKVKELAKKFLSMDNLNESVQPTQPIRRKKSIENILNDRPKTAYMHSLTARSISKEFRDELKLSMATPLKVPGGSKEIPEGEEVIKESSRPGSPLPEPGTIKTKLAFFESLKSKFSSK